ncbi:DEK domain-containing chromatin-associated protein 2 [Linum grandiflorum]
MASETLEENTKPEEEAPVATKEDLKPEQVEEQKADDEKQEDVADKMKDEQDQVDVEMKDKDEELDADIDTSRDQVDAEMIDKPEEVETEMKDKLEEEVKIKEGEDGIKEEIRQGDKDEQPSQEIKEEHSSDNPPVQGNEEEPAQEAVGNKEDEADKEPDEENGQDEGDGEDVEEETEEEEDTEKHKQVSGRSSAKEGDKTPEATEKKETLITSSDRPTRERKMVERYSVPERRRSTAKTPFSVEKGRGTALMDIPNVAFKLSKRKSDETLQMLHTLLYGKKGKVQSMKRNIGKFSGFVWTGNEEKQKSRVKEKLDKFVKEKLLDFCDVLNIQVTKATVRKLDNFFRKNSLQKSWSSWNLLMQQLMFCLLTRYRKSRGGGQWLGKIQALGKHQLRQLRDKNRHPSLRKNKPPLPKVTKKKMLIRLDLKI